MRSWIAGTDSSSAATRRLVAEIEVDGSFDEAPYRAFRPLAGFINGANRSRLRIAMTASVTQREAGPEKIAITAPVMQQAAGRAGSYLVQFVMPSHFTAQTLPVPEDTRVRTRQFPQQLAAAARFSGRWTRKGFEDRGAALRRAVAAAGLRPAGLVRYAASTTLDALVPPAERGRATRPGVTTR